MVEYVNVLIIVRLHLQIPLHQCLPCAYLYADLVTILPEDLSIGDKNFSHIIISPKSIQALPLSEVGGSLVVAHLIVIEVCENTPFGLLRLILSQLR